MIIVEDASFKFASKIILNIKYMQFNNKSCHMCNSTSWIYFFNSTVTKSNYFTKYIASYILLKTNCCESN